MSQGRIRRVCKSCGSISTVSRDKCGLCGGQLIDEPVLPPPAAPATRTPDSPVRNLPLQKSLFTRNPPPSMVPQPSGIPYYSAWMDRKIHDTEIGLILLVIAFVLNAIPVISNFVFILFIIGVVFVIVGRQ